MKRLFLTLMSGLLFIFIFGQTHAQTKIQIEKGDWLLGGSGSFQHLKQSHNVKSDNIQFYPKGGLFIMDNLALGLMPSLEISLTGNDNATSINPNTYTLSVGPFVRYYYPLSSSISLFAEGYATYGTKFIRPKSSSSATSVLAWRVAPGAAFFLTPTTSLDLSIGYSQKNYTSKFGSLKHTDKIDITDFQVGFSIYLPGKNK